MMPSVVIDDVSVGPDSDALTICVNVRNNDPLVGGIISSYATITLSVVTLHKIRLVHSVVEMVSPP